MRVYLGLPTKQAKAGGPYAKSMGEAVRDAPAMGRGARVSLARPLRILLSYHYYKNEDIDALLKECFEGIEIDVFADSGAFSAWTTGATISLDAYADWLKRWESRFSCAAALDVVGDGRASLNQTLKLRKMLAGSKLPIIPVFHTGDRPEGDIKQHFGWLTRYLDEGFDYIGLAPNALRRTNGAKLIRPWIAECFRRKPEAVKYHGFAVTGWALMRDFPWYSVDSSSWTSGFRYASLALFDEARGCLTSINMRTPSEMLAGTKLLASYGLTARDIRADGYDRDLLCGTSVLSWQRAEAWLEKRRATRIFLGVSRPGADNSVGSPRAIRKGLDSLRGD